MKTLLPTEEGRPSGDPSACADGRHVVFLLGFHGTSSTVNIWRVDATGSNLKQLTTGKIDNYPVCAPNSQWVYYVDQSDEPKLARVPIDGGPSQIISKTPIADSAVSFDISADGKRAVFATLEHSGEHKEKLAQVDIESGNTEV